mmetsp:Transcript_30030/g.87784  ORF Transcript_30030/g.87784 Transcript_30030/m.87784 type:complete len:213 (+) Transcript_30030:942-1580(+)
MVCPTCRHEDPPGSDESESWYTRMEPARSPYIGVLVDDTASIVPSLANETTRPNAPPWVGPWRVLRSNHAGPLVVSSNSSPIMVVVLTPPASATTTGGPTTVVVVWVGVCACLFRSGCCCCRCCRPESAGLARDSARANPIAPSTPTTRPACHLWVRSRFRSRTRSFRSCSIRAASASRAAGSSTGEASTMTTSSSTTHAVVTAVTDPTPVK